MKEVSIIGAGIGGLCVGSRLLAAGYRVTIYEKNSHPGGVLHYTESSDGKYKIDTSASLPINPFTYYEIFEATGKKAEDYFTYIPLDINYKVFREKHNPIALSSNLIKTQNTIKKYFSEEVEGYTKFIYDSSFKYLKAKHYLLNRSFITSKSIYIILLKRIAVFVKRKVIL